MTPESEPPSGTLGDNAGSMYACLNRCQREVVHRIDAHVHAFPDRLALAVRTRMSANGGLSGGALLADVAALVRAAGFDSAWVLPYAHRAGVAESANEWSAREVGAYPWLVPGATFHPEDEDIPRLAERALVELRLRVVKLHCSVGQFSPADPRLEPLWRIAAETRAPVIVHAGQVSPGDSAANELQELAPILKAYPGVRIVVAHAGHPATETALNLMSRFDNLHADLTPVWDHPVAITTDDLRRFPGRFLFGSDAPNNPVSASDLARRYEEWPLSETERALLMGGAAEALLN